MRARLTFLLTFLFPLLLTACQPPSASPPLPTVTAVHVQYTPAMAPTLKILSACAGQIPGVGLVVAELPANRMDPAKADLSLRFGSPETAPGFSAAVGEDELVAVVNASNQIVVQSADLSAIFTGRIRDWKDLVDSQSTLAASTPMSKPIQLWSYPPGDDVREIFTKELLGGTAIADHINLAPNPLAMLQAISSDPSAIGYLPQSLVTSQLRVLNFPEKKPAQVPLLALAPAEPQGFTRSLVACLQK